MNLWFATPAERWGEETLPIGNGRLGAMIFGGIACERIQFNEESLWLGDETDPGAYQAFGDLIIEFPGEVCGDAGAAEFRHRLATWPTGGRQVGHVIPDRNH